MEPNLPPQPDQAPVKSKSPFPIIIIGLVVILMIASSAYFYLKREDITQKPGKAFEDVLTVGCPLPPELCRGKDLNKESSLSAVLQESTQLFAAFDGSLFSSPVDDFTIATLSRKDPELQVVYQFKGTAIKNGPVKKGEVIATSSGQLIKSLQDNTSFLFLVIRPGERDNPAANPPLPALKR